MEREVHRLERLITDKQNTIKQLSQANGELQKSLNTANKEIESLKAKAMVTFSYQNIPDREIIKTLQAKVAASAWQILQLQKTNKRYQENILKLHTELLTKQQQLSLNKFQICEAALNSNIATEAQGGSNEAELLKVYENWENTIREKQSLVEENLKLKQDLKNKESQVNQRIGFYLSEVYNLANKIKNQHQQERQRLGQFENIVKQIKKQNQDLRETLKRKNQQILLFYEQSKHISTTKASDLHTIRNLRVEVKKNREKYLKILARLSQTEQLKQTLIEYNKQCSQYIGQFNRLTQSLQNSRRQNGILKQQLTNEQKKVTKSEALIEDTNKKLYELLIENQACHELLFEARGYSKLFLKDIQSKVEKFLQQLEKRRDGCETWLDVTELIAVNQKLRKIPIIEDCD